MAGSTGKGNTPYLWEFNLKLFRAPASLTEVCRFAYSRRVCSGSKCNCLSALHEGMWEAGGVTPCILNLGARKRWIIIFACWPLYPRGRSPCYPLNTHFAGFQSLSGRCREDSERKRKVSRPCSRPVRRLASRICKLPVSTSSPVSLTFHFTYSSCLPVLV
jgi:hypothetical protein